MGHRSIYNLTWLGLAHPIQFNSKGTDYWVIQVWNFEWVFQNHSRSHDLSYILGILEKDFFSMCSKLWMTSVTYHLSVMSVLIPFLRNLTLFQLSPKWSTKKRHNYMPKRKKRQNKEKSPNVMDWLVQNESPQQRAVQIVETGMIQWFRLIKAKYLYYI